MRGRIITGLLVWALIGVVLALPLPGVAMAQDATPGAEADPNAETQKPLTISAEALASLSGQLTEAQFQLLKKTLVGALFVPLDLSALPREAAAPIPGPEDLSAEGATDQAPAADAIVFSDDDIDKIRQSLGLYHEVLVQIQQLAPLLQQINGYRTRIAQLEESMESQMKEEQESSAREVTALRDELGQYLEAFKDLAHRSSLENINFDKLPGMLRDLGYDDAFYDVVFQELSAFIAVIQKTETAQSIIRSLAEVSDTIAQKEQALAAAQAEEEKETIRADLKAMAERKRSLLQNFTLNATGIDVTALEKPATKKVNIEDELGKVFSPLVVGLTDLTEPSRRIEFLRSDIAFYEQNLPKLRKGIAQIDTLIAEVQDFALRRKLQEEKEYWEKQLHEFEAKLDIATQQLVELRNRKLSAVEAFDQFIAAVTSERGLNILFAFVIAFVTAAVLLALRWVVKSVNPLARIPRFRVVANVLDVALYLLAFVLSTLALMVSLYVSGEVLVLAVVAVVLLGLVWAAKDGIPRFIGQILLLLGYGPVRVGERVVHDGIAWEVETIGLFSTFTNPRVTGGRLRLPIRDLIDMRSRPFDPEESWFPCAEGDYILINAEQFRKVVQINPQRVTLDWFDSIESVPTSYFVQQNIRNLSRAPFWGGISFLLSYQHRHDILENNNITALLQDFIEEEYKKLPFGDTLVLPWVSITGFTETSIKMAAWFQVAPEAGPKYGAIHVNLARFCLRAANKYGWEIRQIKTLSIDGPGALGAPGGAPVIAGDTPKA